VFDKLNEEKLVQRYADHKSTSGGCSVTQNMLQYRKQLAPIVVLLLLQFFLRAHNVTAQVAFVDEGFHSARAAVVWSFTINPGQISRGKFLVYYWLGLFVGDHTTTLYTSRTAIALFSLITGALVYLLGRRLYNHRAGVAALMLYCFLSLAVYYERMALADPFAGAFACAVAWRSLVLAKRPTVREGIILGILLALSTMAKLTMVTLPLLRVLACVLYFRSDRSTLLGTLQSWLYHYFRPLLAAALTILVLWLPVLIPAYLARNTPQQFSLIDPVNVAQSRPGISTGV
jgi:4-amino-4-deoxy-L-arabinose transferase-like glycosyltransferase